MKMSKTFLFRYQRSIAIFCLSLLLTINISIASIAGEDSEQLDPAALSHRGQELYNAGKLASAARLWQQAAASYAEIGDRENSLQNSVNTAEALQAVGYNLRACNTLLSAFKLTEFSCRNLLEPDELQAQKAIVRAIAGFPNSLAKVNGLRSLGDIVVKLDALKLSDFLLNKSLTVAEKLSAADEVNAILLSLGNLKQHRGDKVQLATQITSNIYSNNAFNSCALSPTEDAAINYYQQAADLYGRVAANTDSQIVALQALTNQLGISVRLGNRTSVTSLWSEIKPLLANLPANKTVNYTKINLGSKLICFKQAHKTAIVDDRELQDILLTAIASAKKLGDGLTQSYGLGYLGRLYHQQNSQDAISTTRKALTLAQANRAPEVAYQWSWQLGYLLQERGKKSAAIASYREAVNNLQYLRSNLVALDPKIQFHFRDRVEPVYQQLVDLLLRSQPSQADLTLARQTIESLQLLELENFFRQACLEPKIEADLLVDRSHTATAVIYPIVLPDRLEIILKLAGKSQLLHFTTPVGGEDLKTTVATLRDDLSDITKTASVKERSQQLYDWLIKPLSTQLAQNQIETLVFVLNGALRNIPMSVLYDAQQQQYLIEQYAIALAPGLQLVKSNLPSSSDLNLLAAGVSQARTIAGQTFSPLNNVTQELQQISSQVSQSQQLIDREFTRTNLQTRLDRADFSILHLATHGKFSSNPEQTFLLSWDRLLDTQDVAGLIERSSLSKEDALELLVLSACETAKGDRLAALGLAGIAVRSGAKSTLSTLWFADDEYSAKIMNGFYRGLDRGMGKAKALQQAQIAVLKQENRPYLWSPFILIGNWL